MQRRSVHLRGHKNKAEAVNKSNQATQRPRVIRLVLKWKESARKVEVEVKVEMELSRVRQNFVKISLDQLLSPPSNVNVPSSVYWTIKDTGKK